MTTLNPFSFRLLGISLFLLFALNSCGPKTPEEYAEAYCECMEENGGNMKKCKSIIDEAKSAFGEENEEAQKKFKATAMGCLNVE